MPVYIIEGPSGEKVQESFAKKTTEKNSFIAKPNTESLHGSKISRKEELTASTLSDQSQLPISSEWKLSESSTSVPNDFVVSKSFSLVDTKDGSNRSEQIEKKSLIRNAMKNQRLHWILSLGNL